MSQERTYRQYDEIFKKDAVNLVLKEGYSVAQACNLTGAYKGDRSKPFTKTVYDPKIFDDKKIMELGQQAAINGYKNAMKSGIGQYDSVVNGITFRVYLNLKTGAITNFHPK